MVMDKTVAGCEWPFISQIYSIDAITPKKVNFSDYVKEVYCLLQLSYKIHNCASSNMFLLGLCKCFDKWHFQPMFVKDMAVSRMHIWIIWHQWMIYNHMSPNLSE